MANTDVQGSDDQSLLSLAWEVSQDSAERKEITGRKLGLNNQGYHERQQRHFTRAGSQKVPESWLWSDDLTQRVLGTNSFRSRHCVSLSGM